MCLCRGLVGTGFTVCIELSVDTDESSMYIKHMSSKNQNSFWKGFESAFDLYGIGFKRNYRTHSVRTSWYNVGLYFNNTFNRFVSMETEMSDEELREKRRLQKKRYAHR